jgi:GTP-binding protein
VSAESNQDEANAAAEAVEQGRLLFARECQFLGGVVHLDQLPTAPFPETAFAGRSNVGKSSLLNALTGRKALARTSHSPGRTQELNFFLLGESLMLADLPGYGFAKAPKQKVDAWTRLINAYLKGRVPLRRVCLLIDSRHGIKKVDRDVMKLLDTAAVSYQAVLTKCDKIKQSQLSDLIERVAGELATRPAAHPDIIPTSARDGIGISELRAALAALAEPKDFM